MSAWLDIWMGAALKSTVVLGAAWLLVFTLRRRSAAVRHLVWTAAAASLLALPLLTISMPSLPVRTYALAPILSSITFRTTAVASGGASAHTALQAAHQPQNPEQYPTRPLNLRTLIPILWTAGSLLALAQLAAACFVMWRLRRTARAVDDSALLPALIRALGIRREVALFEMPSGRMPLSCGVLRPAVFLPVDAREWSDDRRRVVMLHELAHIRRGDLATQLVARIAVSVFWWNPLAWIAWKEFVKERERAADDLVLTAGEPATEYASHLLEIARSMQAVPVLASAAVAMARPSQLEGRLIAILDARTNRKPLAPRAILAIAALAVALVAPFAALQAQDKPDEAIQPDVQAVIQTAIAQQNHDILDAAATAYASSQKYEAAQQLLESSLTLRAKTSGEHSSAYAVGLMKLGDLSVKRGKTEDAMDFYTRAVALGDTPETAPALIYLATHALVSKDAIAAESFVERALTATPKGAEAGRALTVKGNIALANGLPGVAEVDYLQALAQDPPGSSSAALTMETYARLLRSQDRTAEAQALLAQALPVRQALVSRVSSRLKIDDPAVRVGNGTSPPTLLSKVEPQYSEDARAAKQQGTVMLSITVGTDGLAHNIQVIRSLGFGLDEQAAEAVSQWKFAPGQKDGAAVAVAANIEVNFKLQ
jgi:TonB family protein